MENKIKVKCKNCGYERKHLGEYEDYKCPICSSILNEDKEADTPLENETVGLDEVIRTSIITSFKNDIQRMGKEKVWNIPGKDS